MQHRHSPPEREGRRRSVSDGRSRESPRFIHQGKLLEYHGSVFDKLTDPSLYTGASRFRFDGRGKGRGVEGRDSHALYAVAAREATRDSDDIVYGDDRDARRWSSLLRAGLYSSVVDTHSRLRHEEVLHERDVATRGRAWSKAPADTVPVFERWRFDPQTQTLVLDEAAAVDSPPLKNASSDTTPPPPPSRHQTPMDVFERRYAKQTPPPPPVGKELIVNVDETLPPRPVASWEMRELGKRALGGDARLLPRNDEGRRGDASSSLMEPSQQTAPSQQQRWVPPSVDDLMRAVDSRWNRDPL